MLQSPSPSRFSPAITNEGEKRARKTGKLEGFWRQGFKLGNRWNDTEGKAKWQLKKKEQERKKGQERKIEAKRQTKIKTNRKRKHTKVRARTTQQEDIKKVK